MLKFPFLLSISFLVGLGAAWVSAGRGNNKFTSFRKHGMKKIFLISAALILPAFASSPAWAKHASEAAVKATPVPDNENPVYLGIGTGADLPGSKWDTNYLLGGGANVFLGYKLDRNLSVQLNVEEWFFTGTGYSLDNYRVLAEAKYTFDGQGWQPYVLIGAGPVFQVLSPSGDSTTNFDALGGLGIQFDLAPRTHFYIEAKANFIMSQSTTFSDVPVGAGIWVGL
jgi:hypothetical protein